jgi:stage V sporulation protein R
VISSRDFNEIKASLLSQLTNFGQPIINVVDGNYGNRRELFLSHQHEGMDLDSNFATEVMKNLYRVWSRPVHIQTISEGKEIVISFDGKGVSKSA